MFSEFHLWLLSIPSSHDTNFLHMHLKVALPSGVCPPAFSLLNLILV